MRFEIFSARADACLRACVIALGFAIPVSVALDNILLASALIATIAGSRYRERWNAARNNRVAVAALILMVLLTVGLAYGDRFPGDGMRYWGKYIDLAFVPLFVTAFSNVSTRENGLRALGGALLASMIVSFFWPLGVLYGNPLLPANDVQFPIGFKYAITQSLLVSFGAFLALLAARRCTTRPLKLTLIAIALIASINVMFVMNSRTGYLTLAALLLYFFFQQFRWRGISVLVLAGALASVAGYTGLAGFHERVDVTLRQLHDWQPDETYESSIGTRVKFYTSSLKIIAAHPLAGSGTGSFPSAYAQVNADRHINESANPHNEYLLIAVQTGIIGLAALLYLFYTQWRLAARLEPFYRDLARGLVITFAIGCLFNSLLLDHTEGLFFAWMTGLCFASLPPDDKSRRGT